MDVYKCSKCGGSEHYAYYSSKTGWTNRTCKTCARGVTNDYRRKTNYGTQPQRKAAADRESMMRIYGITPEEYERMLFIQDGVCAICERPPGKRRLAIDHNHATGEIRALLCNTCNVALGCMRDDPVLLETAAKYIRVWR